MKILLLGARGQVGWQLRRSLAVLGPLVALDRHGTVLCGDLERPGDLARTVRETAPDVVVNAAAYTAVDRAETDTARAFAVNAEACEVLAREAAALGAWVVHYSTDYVFAGGGTRPWSEDDATGPLNAYGRSKLAGEEAIRRHAPRHIILRTSWVFDTWGQNFLKTILKRAATQERLEVVDDQWGAPTRAALIADVTAQLLRGLQPAQAGTYHLAAAGETHWHGYASFAVARALQAGAALQARPERIAPVPSSRFPTAATRPANSRLATGKLCDTFGLALPDWRDGVDSVVRELAAFGALPLSAETTP
ncbi:dTDP-4-dehydrorhamnose reductase [Ramlibacter sp.]|uniref:dTDP-4-dehydrorhamnose reductase n=1 Tax=Ramlibacter sp. TaxID=1917967 RepID=UPI0017BA2012|nr:dTDP-4-dehydrorhamnose reductase [Ramlibacter sp.]MBA2673506.1 dTDP-4-dehydrorhamnose reductase [Ramlibacter sp.]